MSIGFLTILIGCFVAFSACDGARTRSDTPQAIASRLSAEGGADSGTPIVESEIALADSSAWGTALAVSGDVLVSTAPRTTVGGNASAGIASVFVRDAATRRWSEQRRLVPHDSTASDQFGLTASIDGETVAVGAPNAGVDGIFQQGAVYVFQRNQGGADQWGEVIKLSNAGVGSGGHFGSSVAIHGDLLVVGATMPRFGGKVMIFERDRGGPNAWGNVATLGDVADGGLNEAFGSAVALDGDLLLIGAAMADVSYYNENDGAAYLFSRDSVDRDRWNYVTRLAAAEALACTGGATLADLASGPADALLEAQRCAREVSHSPNDAFGASVALKGDTAVVGAHFAEGGTGNLFSAGAVYVFQRSVSAPAPWSQVAKLSASDAAQFAYFGDSVALAGNKLLVGAHGAPVDSKLSQGAAYVFERDPTAGVWRETQRITASDGLGNDLFGGAVALSDDTMLVGAAGKLGGQGAVYLYDTPTPDPAPVVPCQPRFPITDTLADGATLTSPTGLFVGSSPGTLPGPTSLWIRQVEAQPEPLWGGAVPLGTPIEVGTGCTLYTPPGHSIDVGLPVPDGVDPARLAAAVLVPPSSILDRPSTDRIWLPAVGVYDAQRHLYLISTASLMAEGTSFLLVDDPSVAPPPLTATTTTIAPETGGSSPPSTFSFYVHCKGWGSNPDLCWPYRQAILEDLDAAYQRYMGQAFPEPSLTLVRWLAPGTAAEATYNLVFVLPSTDPDCTIKGTTAPQAGYYDPGRRAIFLCLNLDRERSAVLEEAERVVAHELFHAVQFGYLAVSSNARDNWVIEGMAAAATFSEWVMTGDPAFKSRVVDVPLNEPSLIPPEYPYRAQDFWVFLLHEEWMPLGGLDSILQGGASTASVADSLGSPRPNMPFAPLGEEYWHWVKSQVIENVFTDCRFDASAFEDHTLIEYPTGYSAPAGIDVHFDGDLQARWVEIAFTRATTNATIHVEGGNDFAFKIYLQGETDSEGNHLCDASIPDSEGAPSEAVPNPGDRTFPFLPAGSVVNVLLANKGYQGGGTSLANVQVIVPE